MQYPKLDEIFSAAGSGGLDLRGMEGGSFPFLVSALWLKKRKPLIVVCKDNQSAVSLFEDIGFFSGGNQPGSLKIFPAPSALPYTHLIPQKDTWIDRNSVLYSLENEEAPLIIVPVDSFMRKVPPKETFYEHIVCVSEGQRLTRDKFLKSLVSAGYNNSPLVEEEGDFAVRGFIVDVWSPAGDRPVRIELDADLVVSIRNFDPETQRTSFTTQSVTIVPVRSVMMSEETISAGLQNIKKRSDSLNFPVVERREFATAIKAGIYPAYTETLLPLFHPDASGMWDYVSKDALYFFHEPAALAESAEKFWGELQNAYKEATHIEKIVEPEDLYYRYDRLEDLLHGRNIINVNSLDIMSLSFPPRAGARGESSPERSALTVTTGSAKSASGKWIEGSQEGSLNNFVGRLNGWMGEKQKIILVCHTSMQADRLIDLLRWQGLVPRIADKCFFEMWNIDCHCEERSDAAISRGIDVTIGSLSEGFVWPDMGLAVLSEKDMFGKRIKRLPAVTRYPTEAFTSFQDLEDGDCIVHIKHGVGRYRGMRHMAFGEMKNDFLELEYLGGDRLYVPAYRLNLVQKYVGPGDGAPFLDKLGGKRWEKARVKADRAVRKMAKELLRLYAARQIRAGYAFSGRDHLMEEFEAAFPYDETPDQMNAIEDVIKDMQDPHPADRLICGDVGYGKTEVAIRGAFRAVMDGKQVAVLVPTTILAFQHYETFSNRFKNTIVNVDLLNRFRTKTDQKDVVDGLNKGKIDIVIGTHRLVQKDVRFKDLGLLIIDEEHRFGVRQKEGIKKLKETVDVISMSATPIPRSLHISLVGARDISVINTAPANRLSIRTYVAEFDEGLIKGAVLKEVRRGGQVFFVHNRVETIQSMAERLGRLIPEIKIGVGHGQMHEHELEEVMVKFVRKEFDLLLCTTIIESGLDIPSANTIIINRADTFGLAQLYQLRGRVGRSNVQAFAYLLIPEGAAITSIATKRLATIQKYTELGSGFQIAMHDLEIRGAGNILGAEQSGHISAIGYELYTELLEREVRKLKGEEIETGSDTEIQIPVEAYFPSTYIPDDNTRIVFYKRLSSLTDEDDPIRLGAELEDRFGKLPDTAKNLLNVVEIKIAAGKLGIESIQSRGANFVYRFSERTPIAPEKILKLAEKSKGRIKIRPDSSILIVEKEDVGEKIFSIIKSHLNMFSAK